MNQNAKTKRDFPYVTLILAVTIVLVVAILGYTVFDSVGIIGRLDNAAKSNNMKLNENHVDVYRYHVAQNQLYYQYMYIQWGIMSDPTGGYITSGLWDATTYINFMLPNYVGSSDFDASAYEYAKQYLAYCEGAKEAGKYDELKEKTAADVAKYMESLQVLADANQVSLNKYISQWIGRGVSKSDVETAMEYYYIGIEYADSLFEDYSDKVTAEEIQKYVNDNKATFYTSAITYYTIASDAMKEAIEACKTADEVKTAIVDYYMEQKFESNYNTQIVEKEITDADKDKTKADVRTTLLAMNKIGDAEAVFKSDDTDAYKKACYNIANTINSTVKTQVAKVTENDQAWADATASSATDLTKWLFGDAGRKAGDTTVIKTETKDSTGKVTATTYTWYVVNEHNVLDTEKTKNIHYVLLTDDAKDTEGGKTAAQKVEAFWTALEANKTAEKFAELVAEYQPSVSGEVNERLSYDDIKTSNEALADWMYEEGRKEGDIFKTEAKEDTKDANKVTGYYVAYFVDENEETWSLTAREALASEDLQKWYEEAVVKYNVTVDYEEATTAASTTAASTTASTEKPTEATTDAATEAPTEDATEATTEEATTAA